MEKEALAFAQAVIIAFRKRYWFMGGQAQLYPKN